MPCRGVTYGGTASTVANAWIDPRVAEVDDQVDNYRDCTIDQHEILNHHPVACIQRLHQVRAETRYTERRLSGDGSSNEGTHRRSRGRDYRQECIAHHVPANNCLFLQTLRARGPNVVVE